MDMHSCPFQLFSCCGAAWLETGGDELRRLARRTKGNFEDQIRAANELLRGLEILAAEGKDSEDREQARVLRSEIRNILDQFASSILQGERDVVAGDADRCEQAFNYLVSFLMSFASRSGTRERLHIFTTNYDRYIEAAADLAGLRLIDRFVGTLSPVFRASRLDVDLHYNPPGIRGEPRYLEGVARFTKLHGSVDWIDCDRAIRRLALPFGAKEPKPFLEASGLGKAEALRLMIYPNAAKDRETAAYPYVELFRDFAAAICRPNSTVVTYGYGFGDEHINQDIEAAMSAFGSQLTLIAFSGEREGLPPVLESWRKNSWGERIYVVSSKGLYNGARGPYWQLADARDWWTFSGVTELLANGLPADIQEAMA